MDLITFSIRIPKDLNEWLIKQAAYHNRSKGGEVINILTLAKARAEAVKDSRQDERWLTMKGDK